MKNILFPFAAIVLLFCAISCRDADDPGGIFNDDDERLNVVCNDPARSLEDPSITWGSTQKIKKPLQMNAAKTHYTAGVVEYYIGDKLDAYVQYYEDNGQYYGIKKMREYHTSCGVDGRLSAVPADNFSTCKFQQQSMKKES